AQRRGSATNSNWTSSCNREFGFRAGSRQRPVAVAKHGALTRPRSTTVSWEIEMPIKGADILEIVNKMHEEKKIPKEVIFSGIEAALQVAIERATGQEEENSTVSVSIDRLSGQIDAK